jgi:hypothetical protein
MLDPEFWLVLCSKWLLAKEDAEVRLGGEGEMTNCLLCTQTVDHVSFGLSAIYTYIQ